MAVGAAALSLVALHAYGLARLAQPARDPDPAVWVRVVQANVDQASKYDEALFRSIVGRYVRLTAQPAPRVPDIVIWPEGAIPDSVNDYLGPNTWTRAAIAGALRPGQSLLLGGYRLTGDPDRAPAYNSLLALRSEGGDLVMTGLYDKFRLVPFGEYLPAETLLGPLGFKKLVHVTDGFDSGPRPRPISPEGVPQVQPLICYESLFPGFAREGAKRGGRARWIVNISNDAWFGKTSGPWQHLNLASYRAIEEGLPMVRATPTGISAVIDAYGRIRPGAVLGQGALGVIDAPLPAALPPTPFSRWGEIFFWSAMTLSAAIGRYARAGRNVGAE
jgi:apolipoprotein N-acyltransferase